MYILLRYPVGVVVEGVVLKSGKNRMRVAAAGFPDIIELKRSGSNWVGADKQPVELEFMMFQSVGTSEVEAEQPVHGVRAIGFAASYC